MEDKFAMQERQYVFPYHYLVDLKKYNNQKRLDWGLEYYSYMTHTIDYVSKLDFTTLLDIGCGDGRLISELADGSDPKKHYTGVDLAEPAIYLAKGLNFFRKNAIFVRGDFGELNGIYDVVVLNEVLEHIPDDSYDVFCRNVSAKLSAGGRVVITVPADNFAVHKKHFRHYNVKMIRDSFRGLKLERVNYIYRYNQFVRFAIAATSRMPGMRALELSLGKALLFKADEKNCRHIFCVLTKP